MDDHVVSAAFEPHWVRHAGGMPPAARVPRPRGSLFLRRDLSDEALRQPPEPLFSQADLAAVRQEGFDAGHAAGMAAAAASRAAARTASEIQALGTIAALMADARKESARVADLAADALARTVIAAMDGVMPDLIRRSALSEVGAMLALVLPGLSREPAVRVEVPLEIADAIAATLASLPPEQRDTVTVAGLAPMRPGEARVHWAAGHARRQPAQVWEAVMQALHPALGHPELDQPELNHPEPEHAKLDHPKLDHAAKWDSPKQRTATMAIDDEFDTVAASPPDAPNGNADLEAIYDVPVTVSAVLGKASMQVSQLLKLGRGAVVELDRKLGEAIDIYVNNRLVARGEVVMVDDDRLGITMTEIVKSDRAN